jgi:AcrR family transcriptional regulator
MPTKAKPLDLESGRANQKARTREALVDAAIALVSEGKEFSVPDVADLARVSRTTAYNYFPTVESLYRQAVLTFVARQDLGFYELFERSRDVTERVTSVVEMSDASVNAHEPQYRGLLGVSLESHDDDLPRRPAYRPKWLTDALEPVREQLDPSAFERLVSALSLTVGIEAHVTLRDVCGLSAPQARRTKVWAAQALLASALAEQRKRET